MYPFRPYKIDIYILGSGLNRSIFRLLMGYMFRRNNFAVQSQQRRLRQYIQPKTAGQTNPQSQSFPDLKAIPIDQPLMSALRSYHQK